MLSNILRSLRSFWNYHFHSRRNSCGGDHRSHRHDSLWHLLAHWPKKVGLTLGLSTALFVASFLAMPFLATPSYAVSKIDVDLTKLSKTMVYAEVYHMVSKPEDYVGKIVKVKGVLAIAQDEETGTYYTAVLIADAAACCQQGLEFEWTGHKYPKDFPKVGSKISLTGKFTTYEENGMTYIRIVTDKLHW